MKEKQQHYKYTLEKREEEGGHFVETSGKVDRDVPERTGEEREEYATSSFYGEERQRRKEGRNATHSSLLRGGHMAFYFSLLGKEKGY